MESAVQSMTGYGRYQQQDAAWEQVWEIRSVNSRYLEIKWRLPQSCRFMESEWDKAVREFLHRGRVEVSLDLRLLTPEAACPALNKAQVVGMVDQLRQMAKTLGHTFQPDLNQVLLAPALWLDNSAQLPADLTQALTQGLLTALKDIQQARLREGRALTADILLRLEHLSTIVEQIHPLAAELAPKRMQNLTDRVSILLTSVEKNMDEARMLQELALLADKLDVSEELTRLGEHLPEANRILTTTQDPGRRLDFVFQECLREITTCGNKTQDALISRLVIEFKAELEKCREQIQNLE